LQTLQRVFGRSVKGQLSYFSCRKCAYRNDFAAPEDSCLGMRDFLRWCSGLLSVAILMAIKFYVLLFGFLLHDRYRFGKYFVSLSLFSLILIHSRLPEDILI
jgi:hypothetical protein